jgi:hypothetical protein
MSTWQMRTGCSAATLKAGGCGAGAHPSFARPGYLQVRRGPGACDPSLPVAVIRYPRRRTSLVTGRLSEVRLLGSIRTDVLASEAALSGGEVEFARDLDATIDGSGDRTRVGIDLYHPLYLLAIFLIGGKVEGLLDPLDNEYLLLGHYLAHRVGVEAAEGNLTRYQRAPKGTQQSTARRRHHVSSVDSCGSSSAGR